MSNPSPTPAIDTWAHQSEVAATIEMAIKERGTSIESVGNDVPGMTKSKLYRRLRSAGEFTLNEISELGEHLSVPPAVLVAGRMETLRYLRSEGMDPDRDPSNGAVSRISSSTGYRAFAQPDAEAHSSLAA